MTTGSSLQGDPGITEMHSQVNRLESPRPRPERITPMRNRTTGTALTIAALAIAACNQAATTATAPPQTTAFPEDYGEFYARPEELASVPANAIAKSMRMNVTAMGLGLQVYDKNCEIGRAHV